MFPLGQWKGSRLGVLGFATLNVTGAKRNPSRHVAIFFR